MILFLCRFYQKQYLSIFYGARVIRKDIHYLSFDFRLYLVHEFHRLDDAEDLSFCYLCPHFDKR